VARPAPRRERNPFDQSEQGGAVTVLTQAAVELYYDYTRLPEEKREAAQRAARIIKPLLKRTAEDIFLIGHELSQIKEMLPHGRYTEWLGVEFGLSERMAQHFVNVRRRLGPKSEKFSVLPPSTLYLLAAPSTPDTAIIEIEQQLDAGRRISVTVVQETIRTAKRALPMLEAGPPTTIEGIATRRERPPQPTPGELAQLTDALERALELLGEPAASVYLALMDDGDLAALRKDLRSLRLRVAERMARLGELDQPT
jgi:hypothetical protein